MNRSILLSSFVLACIAAPLALLASEPPEAASAAASGAGQAKDAPRDGTRCLSEDERNKLREQVRQAAEESSETVPAAAAATIEKDGGQ
ncbi:MAG: hypothetical protein IKH84_02125 [Ottowia sp.]|nr:hypothetical protein [Ottowia sp.]